MGSPQPGAAPSAVLVVDDEDLVRNVSRLMLERLGYTVHVAASGPEALTQFERHPDIRVVLLDVSMPGMSGLDTMRALRGLDPDLRFVLTSGFGEQDAAERMPGEEPAGFLQKPFQMPALRDAIAAAVRG